MCHCFVRKTSNLCLNFLNLQHIISIFLFENQKAVTQNCSNECEATDDWIQRKENDCRYWWESCVEDVHK